MKEPRPIFVTVRKSLHSLKMAFVKHLTNLGNQESSGMMKLFMPRPKALTQYESIQFMLR
uniref:Uncharacterized protein n=1 Tax=Saimiri boliviensis boliviensis TaxID=39432 RepID=A0A2K6SDQ7_SAIBB